MPTTRFAPSPTGLLHLGHAHSALFAFQQAKGGRFLLRIEDIDHTRCRPEFDAAALEDLHWLGLRWDPPVRRQSNHLDSYTIALQQLEADGLLYPCFCTRRDIEAEIARAGSAPQGPDGPVYPGVCRAPDATTRAVWLQEGRPHAWRLAMDRAVARATQAAGPLRFYERSRGWVLAEPAVFGDVVLARKDIRTSYHLAVTLDDALQGVEVVTRGEDLLPATHIHRLLQALLKLPVPEWHHHGLIRDQTGRRLAKRDGARALADLRAQGLTAPEVRALAGFGEIDLNHSPSQSGAAQQPGDDSGGDR